jgi:CubicO group peptidase (beta-lactamase class C family)
MYFLRPLAVAAVLALPPAAVAQAPPFEQAEAVDKAVRAEMAKGQLVGVAVGVIRDGKVVYLKGYGQGDRENNVPVTSKTLFRWASCSKPVTALAAMQLVEQGKLDLHADVRGYVPEFPDKGVKLTTRQLLCHQAGIVHYANGKVIRTERKYDSPNPFEDVVLALDTFKDSPLVNKPGEKFSYTTHGYILLSAVVERAGKQKFADQVAGRIAKPLEMTTFRPDYQWLKLPDRAVGYVKKGDKVVPSSDTDVSWKLGGGGFVSNIDDFAKFAAGLMSRKLVSEKTEALMWTPQKTADGEPTVGFQIARSPLRVSHTGAQEKTRTVFTIDPKARTGVVVMTNSEWANPTQVAAAVSNAVAAK